VSRELDPPVLVTPEADTRPGCGGATGARSPRPYFDCLVAAVERLNTARFISRQLRVLAEEAPTITNEQLADRLLALADRLRALP
jgi:hypothetical protein